MKGLFFTVLFFWVILSTIIIRRAIHTIDELRAEVVQRDFLIEALKEGLVEQQTAVDAMLLLQKTTFDAMLLQQQTGAKEILDRLTLQNSILQQNLEREAGRRWN